VGDRLRRVGLLILLALPTPAWAQSPGGSWQDLPGTSFRALVPPGPAGSAVTAAWSGAACDSRRQRLHRPAPACTRAPRVPSSRSSLDDPSAGAQRWTFTGATDFLRVQGPGLAKHSSGLWYGWAGQNEVWTMDLDAKVLAKLPPGPLTVPEGRVINKGVYGRWAFDAARGAFFGIAHVDSNAVRFTPPARP